MNLIKLKNTTAIIILLFYAFLSGCEDSKKTESLEERIVKNEELVYKDFFNPNSQIILARDYWELYEKSNYKNNFAISQSITAYGIAYIESNKSEEIAREIGNKSDLLKKLTGFSFNLSTIDNMALVYKAVKQDCNQIFKIRSEYEKLWKEILIKKKNTQSLEATYSAVMEYLKRIYKVTTGRKLKITLDGNIIKFGKIFYDKWEDGLRKYGLILNATDDFAITENLNYPIEKFASQITEDNTWKGLFKLPNGGIIVPGLAYFKDFS